MNSKLFAPLTDTTAILYLAVALSAGALGMFCHITNFLHAPEFANYMLMLSEAMLFTFVGVFSYNSVRENKQ